jgi:hypothetical protein
MGNFLDLLRGEAPAVQFDIKGTHALVIGPSSDGFED